MLVPDVRVEERQRCVTTIHHVPKTYTQQVVTHCPVKVAVCDPCTGMTGFIWRFVPQVREVCVTRYCPVPEHARKYTVTVPTVRPEQQTFKVQVPTVREELVTKKIPVTTRPETGRSTLPASR